VHGVKWRRIETVRRFVSLRAGFPFFQLFVSQNEVVFPYFLPRTDVEVIVRSPLEIVGLDDRFPRHPSEPHLQFFVVPPVSRVQFGSRRDLEGIFGHAVEYVKQRLFGKEGKFRGRRLHGGLHVVALRQEVVGFFLSGRVCKRRQEGGIQTIWRVQVEA